MPARAARILAAANRARTATGAAESIEDIDGCNLDFNAGRDDEDDAFEGGDADAADADGIDTFGAVADADDKADRDDTTEKSAAPAGVLRSARSTRGIERRGASAT